jgi:Derlin-2/3
MPANVQQGNQTTPADWYYSLPPISRLYGTAAVATTIATSLGLLDLRSLYLSWPLVLRGQVVYDIYMPDRVSEMEEGC